MVTYKNGEWLANSSEDTEQKTESAERHFTEDFNDNSNDWDILVSPNHSTEINGGSIHLTSLTPLGTGRFIKKNIVSSLFEI